MIAFVRGCTASFCGIEKVRKSRIDPTRALTRWSRYKTRYQSLKNGFLNYFQSCLLRPSIPTFSWAQGTQLTAMETLALPSLPLEILLDIQSYLSYASRIALRLTCRELHCKIDNPNRRVNDAHTGRTNSSLFSSLVRLRHCAFGVAV